MVLRISDGCRCIRAYRGFNGSTARPFLHGIVQASDEKESNTQCQRADKEGDENGRDNSELYRRGSLIVDAYRFQVTAHDQPNLTRAVLLIGVAKVLVTLRPGNNGA